MSKILAVWLPEPMREGEYPEGAKVGEGGVLEIVQREEFCGSYKILWYDVFGPGYKRVKSFNALHVASVYYA